MTRSTTVILVLSLVWTLSGCGGTDSVDLDAEFHVPDIDFTAYRRADICVDLEGDGTGHNGATKKDCIDTTKVIYHFSDGTIRIPSLLEDSIYVHRTKKGVQISLDPAPGNQRIGILTWSHNKGDYCKKNCVTPFNGGDTGEGDIISSRMTFGKGRIHNLAIAEPSAYDILSQVESNGQWTTVSKVTVQVF